MRVRGGGQSRLQGSGREVVFGVKGKKEDKWKEVGNRILRHVS